MVEMFGVEVTALEEVMLGMNQASHLPVDQRTGTTVGDTEVLATAIALCYSCRVQQYAT